MRGSRGSSLLHLPVLVEQSGELQVWHFRPGLGLDDRVIAPARHAVIAVVVAVHDRETGIEYYVLRGIDWTGINQGGEALVRREILLAHRHSVLGPLHGKLAVELGDPPVAAGIAEQH